MAMDRDPENPAWIRSPRSSRKRTRSRNDWRAGYIERCTSGSEGGSRRPAVAIQQGGGFLPYKTTTTRNLGAALAARGKKVLVVDLDPQGHLTLSFGINPLSLKKHAYHVMIDEGVSIADVLIYHQFSGVGLVPANLDLSGAEVELLSDPFGNNVVLKAKIAPIRDRVDYILIDTPQVSVF